MPFWARIWSEGGRLCLYGIAGFTNPWHHAKGSFESITNACKMHTLHMQWWRLECAAVVIGINVLPQVELNSIMAAVPTTHSQPSDHSSSYGLSSRFGLCILSVSSAPFWIDRAPASSALSYSRLSIEPRRLDSYDGIQWRTSNTTFILPSFIIQSLTHQTPTLRFQTTSKSHYTNLTTRIAQVAHNRIKTGQNGTRCSHRDDGHSGHGSKQQHYNFRTFSLTLCSSINRTNSTKLPYPRI